MVLFVAAAVFGIGYLVDAWVAEARCRTAAEARYRAAAETRYRALLDRRMEAIKIP